MTQSTNQVANQVRPVYFLSRHEATKEMVAELGGINAQFTGNIFNPSRKGDMILFTQEDIETMAKVDFAIPANSIVVAVAPLPLQQQWLAALGNDGVFLIPQNNRIVHPDKSVEFRYSGLLWVKRIVIETEQWAGRTPSTEEKAQERIALLT
jgi:hypothetical protein